VTVAKTYSLRERIKRALYEKMFDAALFMASRLSEKDKRLFAWLLKPRAERWETMMYTGPAIRYRKQKTHDKPS
jgi:hypothetical protein